MIKGDINDVKLGDHVVALMVDSSIGDYEIGDILEVVDDAGGEAYINDRKIEINALTKSFFAESNREHFAIFKRKIEPSFTVKLDESCFITNANIVEAAKPNDQYFKGLVLGVARPDLETRKIGKNRIELVDKGFPNALWEVARLMTKAQDVKQYEDHDWKNLSSDVFSSAASRHRVKHNMGELYDDEFAGEGFMILHKVNEAFNVLAELELLLTK